MKQADLPVPRRVSGVSALLAAFALVGCVPARHIAERQAPAPTFDAVAFFSGHTEGKGTLKVAFRRPEPTLVEGEGKVAADGSIVLDQTVRRGSRPAMHRQWHLRAVGVGHYVGTLTDAVSPVYGTVVGNRLDLTFRMKGGLKAEQWLFLDRDGGAAHNIMIFRKLGMPAARLDEIITRMAK